MNSICTNNIFQITDFLNDRHSLNLFSINRFFHALFISHPELYTVKKIFYDSDIIQISRVYPYLPRQIANLFKKFKYTEIYWTSNTFDSTNVNTKWLKTLHFSTYFNGSVDNLPERLKYLRLDTVEFNQPLDHLPKSLQRLELGDSFNQPLNNLPEGLKFLRIVSAYTHKLDHLPKSLTHLILDGDFNMPIDHLPENLIFLHLGTEFNRSLDNLPLSLRVLVIETDLQLDTSNVNPVCKIYNCIEDIVDFNILYFDDDML